MWCGKFEGQEVESCRVGAADVREFRMARILQLFGSNIAKAPLAGPPHSRSKPNRNTTESLQHNVAALPPCATHPAPATPALAPILMRRCLHTQPQHCMLQQPHPHISQAFRTRLIPATNNQPVLPVAHSPPLRLLFFCPPLMDDWGKCLRRAASAAKPPAPLQVALARSPHKKTKRACAGPCAMTLPGEGLGGDGVKAQAGQGRARKRCEHGRERSKCKDCGGSGICEHGRRRRQCKDCKGSGICEHGRQRTRCKDCGGGGIC